MASFWVALAGAVASLGLFVGMMALVANRGASDSKQGQTLPRGDTRADKTDQAVPDEDTLPPQNPGDTPVDEQNRSTPGETALRPREPVGEIRRFVGHSATGDGVVDVAFAPDGRTAVSGGQDKVIRLWDVETGEEVRRFEGHTGRVTCLCFTPDGLHVVSGSDDKTLRLWDVASGKEVRRFEGHSHNISYYMAVTPDGERLVSGSGNMDTTVRIWDLKSSKELRRFDYRGRNDESIGIAAFSPDGRRALIWRRFEYRGTKEESLRLWDVDQGAMLRILHEQSLGGAFSPDGQFAVAFGLDKHLRLYDVGSGKLIRRFQQGPAGVVTASFSPDGQRLLACYLELDSAGLWDVRSGREIHRIAGNPKGIGRMRFSPDGRRAISAERDGTVRLWRLPN